MQMIMYSLGMILITASIGIYLSRRVHTIKGYAVADRSLPLYVSTATVFATWFGAEAILGIPESFMTHGLIGVMSDPIGAALCLILIGFFLARHYYHMNVISICDFFYNRYGKLIEMLLGTAVAFSYFGWIAAQFIAFGEVLSFLLGATITTQTGIIISALIVIGYTFKGGMFAVAINDFIQTLIILLSLSLMAILVCEKAGGIGAVIDYAIESNRTEFRFDGEYPNFTFVLGVVLSMILGTVPQQDTFQRITSAKSAKIAVQSTILGGIVYFLITLLPIFIVLAAAKMELAAKGALPEDFNMYIINFVKEHVPTPVQVCFYSALFAAILSTASGTILAASVVLSRNVLGEFFSREANLLVMRLTLVVMTLSICIFSLYSTSSIHGLVEDSGKVTMVIVFFPLILGMFWHRTSYTGVLAGIIASAGVWLGLITYQNIHDTKIAIAPEVIGFAISFFVIVIGSLCFPDSKQMKHKITHHRHIQ
jgi:Na+/proline symporter